MEPPTADYDRDWLTPSAPHKEEDLAPQFITLEMPEIPERYDEFNKIDDFHPSEWDRWDISQTIGYGLDENQEDVAHIQKMLKGFGFIPDYAGDDPKGVLGHNTKQGIMAFQHALGLEPDGIITPGGSTAKAMEAMSRIAQTIDTPSAMSGLNKKILVKDLKRATITDPVLLQKTPMCKCFKWVRPLLVTSFIP